MNKRKFSLIFVLILCFSGLISVLFIQKVKANSDLDYIFDNDYIFNSDDLTYETFNIRNQTSIFQDNFTATYDFLDIPISTIGTDIDFIDSTNNIPPNNVSILENLSGHNHILNLTSLGVSNAEATHLVGSNEQYGTIEFWWYTTDITTSRAYVYLTNTANSNILIKLYLRDDNIRWHDGTNFHDITSGLSNVWYHISINYECTIGSYMELAQYKWNILINGIEYGVYTFVNNEPHVSEMTIIMNDESCYFDAIGFSWDIDYDIGQNIAYPEITNIEIQEIDTCEFAYNLTTLEPNTLDSNIIDNNWIENDGASDIHVKTSGVFDEIDIDYGSSQDQDDYGIYKEFEYNLENIFNITFDITSIDLYNPHLDGWYFNIYSYDDTLLVSLLFTGTDLPDISLYYYDGSDYIFIHELLDVIGSFSLNIYINNRVILSLNNKDVNYNWYFSELTDKIGINTIEVIGGHKDDIGDFAKLVIDSIGLYINGSSYLPDDLLSIIVDTNIENWNDSIHNLFEITGNGNFSFSVYYNTVFEDVIIPYSEYNNEMKRVHYIDGNIFKGSSPYTFVCINNVSFTVSKISVYAVILTEGVNDYYMIFTYENVDIEINFFYVSNNRLYFTHNANQNDTLEYIQAKFNIDDIYAINRSISFRTSFLGISKAYFINNYVSNTNTTFIFRIGYESINYILPQQQIIKSFTILITDNNNNDYYGNSEGYISSLKLRYYTDITLIITTIELIEVIIPLLLIIIPTLAIYYHYGKSSIIPVILLMSILVFVSNLIPIWLLFLIIYSSSIYLILQQKSGGI